MPKLKYLLACNLSSQQKYIWSQKCPNVVFNGDENCNEHFIASPYEFGGWLEGQVWEIPNCKNVQFEDPFDEDEWDPQPAQETEEVWDEFGQSGQSDLYGQVEQSGQSKLYGKEEQARQSGESQPYEQGGQSGQLEQSTFERFPNEVILKILSFLTIKDLGRCAQVSKMFCTNAYDSSLWKKISIVSGIESKIHKVV